MSRTRILLATVMALIAALPATAQPSPKQSEPPLLKTPPATNAESFSDTAVADPDAAKAKSDVKAPAGSGAGPPNKAASAAGVDEARRGAVAPDLMRELDEYGTDEPPPDRNGLLGSSVLTDSLALALAVLFGALLGGLLGAQRARGHARGHFTRLNDRILDIERRLSASAKLSQPAAAPPPPPTRRPLYGGPAPYDLDPDGTDFPPAPAARGDMRPAADSGLRAAELERSRKLNQAVEDYCRLVATKGARPRQFEEQLAAFPKLLSVRPDSGNLIGEPYREGDANQIVVAAGDGEHFAVLPTYEYVSNFSMAFSKLVSTPPIVSQLFDLHEDETGQLRLIRAATVEMEDSSVLRVSGKGRLSGFRS